MEDLVIGEDRGPNTAVTNSKHEITIKEQDRGYVVKVGCRSFCFTERKEMLKLIEMYLSNRQGVEEKFNDGKLF
ncbi:MAG: hypothetical protein KAS32_09450 [Candidatus Peribacteraceae bacterium]|nr:hypothetical protein [Candidatus Peribacteraceae bacterium]